MTRPMRQGDTYPVAGFALDRMPMASEPTHAHPEERLQALTADLHHRIQVAAYYRAERGGCTPGQELDDWFAAEEFIASDDAARTAED